MGDITTNFDSKEFETDNGEFNLCTQYPLALQAFRSWFGDSIFISDGCRKDMSDSAHNIVLYGGCVAKTIMIPATGSDIYVKGLDSWGLMDKVEEWVSLIQLQVMDWDDITKEEKLINWYEEPIFTGLGVYPDTHCQCIHLDMGHLSLNPAIREKRKRVKRWVRIGRVYHYARDGESFAQMRARLT